MTEKIDKIAAYPSHEYYRSDYYNYAAFLNGIKLEFCCTANAIEGWAECHDLDENGNGQMNEKRDGVKLKRVTGHIEIRRIDEQR
jgi:hypothetical protein